MNSTIALLVKISSTICIVGFLNKISCQQYIVKPLMKIYHIEKLNENTGTDSVLCLRTVLFV